MLLFIFRPLTYPNHVRDFFVCSHSKCDKSHQFSPHSDVAKKSNISKCKFSGLFQPKRPIEKLDLDLPQYRKATIKHEPPLIDQWLIRATVSPGGTHGSSEGFSLVSICSQSRSSSRPWVYPQDEKGFSKSQSPATKEQTFILSALFPLPQPGNERFLLLLAYFRHDAAARNAICQTTAALKPRWRAIRSERTAQHIYYHH